MKNEDKEAFEKWYKINFSELVKETGIAKMEKDFTNAWQAACEYKKKEIDARKSELEYATKILTDLQADKLEMRGQMQKLEAENAKLREALLEISQETRVIEGVECSTNEAMIAAEALKELDEKL